MKDLRLLSLTLRDFQGVTYTFSPGGRSASIYGMNGTGKTRLFSAFAWLLFGKDSVDRADFCIKNLDLAGEAAHGLEHTVEGVFTIEGKTGTLRKTYKEVWTKPKGSATKVFSGHTTEHYVDGVPVRKADYDARIAAIIDERTFRLLTDPAHFNEKLTWQERRAILLAVCGDLADSEVIASEPKLADLTAILGDRKLEDHKRALAAAMGKINKALQEIPVKIGERQRGLPCIEDGVTIASASSALASAKELHRKRVAEMAAGSTENAAAALKTERDELHDRMRGYEDAERTRLNELLEAKRKEVRRAEDELRRAEGEEGLRRDAARCAHNAMADYANQSEGLDADFADVSAREFTHTDETVCPTCGQAIPEEQVAEARANALAAFNAGRSQRLEAIAAERKRVKSGLGIAETAFVFERSAHATVVSKRDELNARLTTLRAEAKRIEDTDPVDSLAFTNDAYGEMLSRLMTLGKELAALTAPTEDTPEPDPELERLELAVTEAERLASQVEERDRDLARIEDLMAEERRLAAEYEKLDRERFLCEEFTRAKARLLTDKINSRFALARFRLFETQVNGGIADACETTVDGVPYSGGLNHGNQMNAGLDIVNVLSDHYGFRAPVWLDFAESVTALLPVKAQMIRLVVSLPDKVLRVKLDETEDKEAV